MKRIVLLILLFTGQSAYRSALAADSPKAEEAEQTNAVLEESEMTGLKIEKTTIRPWWVGTDSKGKTEENGGVEQNVAIQDVKARIHYTEFPTGDQAHQAAEFYSKNMASIFRPGLWNGAKEPFYGDETWFSLETETLAVLVRSGKICVLISCRDGDAAKRENVAEVLAQRIAGKANKGGRVHIPQNR